MVYRVDEQVLVDSLEPAIRERFERELPARRDLEAYGIRWKPYRTVASWYLWRLVEQTPLQKVQ